MDITKLLNYQEVNKELYELNRNLNQSPEAKAVSQYKKFYDEAKESLIKLDRVAGELIMTFEESIKKLKANEIKTDEIKKVINDIDDITEIEYMQKKLDELIHECNQLSRDLTVTREKIQYVKVKTNEATKQGKESYDKMKDAKTAYDNIKAELNPKATKIIDKIKQLEAEINDNEFIERFKRLMNNNIIPPLVKCEDALCTGCGINIASNLQSKLKDTDELPECPNCGRILYSAVQ